MPEIFGLSLLAGVFALDVTAFGQIMISRPIVCGPIFGYILGDIVSGFWISLIIELIWINAIPMGTSIPQDVTVVSILSCVWGIKYLHDEKGAIIFAMALALLLGFLFRYFDVRLRYFNSRIAEWIKVGISSGKESRIDVGVYLGIFLFFVKAFLFYLLFIYLGKVFLKDIFFMIPLYIRSGLYVAWYLLPVVGFGISFFGSSFGKLGCFK